MTGLSNVVAQSPGAWVLGALAVSALAILTCALVLARMAKLARLYASLTRGTSGGNLESVLSEHMAGLGAVRARTDSSERRLDTIEAVLQTCLQRHAMVRFDAFDDVGGEQSFALALLDASDTGVVVTSILGRTDHRIYAKPIKEGRSTQPLTDEERRAIAGASDRSRG